MVTNSGVFEHFSLNMLEARDVLNKMRGVDTIEFLKQDLSIFNESELCSILTKKKSFNYYEKCLIKFWASLFKNKKLFEISIGNKVTDLEFKQVLEEFICSSDFKYEFKNIQWTHIFSNFNNLTLNNAMNFYENVACSMASKGELSVELIEKIDLIGVNWDYVYIDGEVVLTHLCCEYPKVDLIRCLLTKKVGVNIQNDIGQTGFMYLCTISPLILEMVQLFLDKGVDVNIQNEFGETAFMQLCTNRGITLEMVQLFLDKGVDVNTRNNHGATAFMNLCENRSATIDMIQLLLDNGVDINAQEEEFGQTGFMNLCANKAIVTGDIIKLFLNNGVDAGIQNKQCETALHCYLYVGGKDQEVLRLLNSI